MNKIKIISIILMASVLSACKEGSYSNFTREAYNTNGTMKTSFKDCRFTFMFYDGYILYEVKGKFDDCVHPAKPRNGVGK